VSGRPGAVLYTRAGCPPCFALGRLAARSSRRHRVSLIEVEVDADPDLVDRYGERVPVLVLPGGRSISGRAAAREVDDAFGRAALFLRGLEAKPSAAGSPVVRRGIEWIRRTLGRDDGGSGGRTA
jgi:glutaredoxin